MLAEEIIDAEYQEQQKKKKKKIKNEGKINMFSDFFSEVEY